MKCFEAKLYSRNTRQIARRQLRSGTKQHSQHPDPPTGPNHAPVDWRKFGKVRKLSPPLPASHPPSPHLNLPFLKSGRFMWGRGWGEEDSFGGRGADTLRFWRAIDF